MGREYPELEADGPKLFAERKRVLEGKVVQLVEQGRNTEGHFDKEQVEEVAKLIGEMRNFFRMDFAEATAERDDFVLREGLQLCATLRDQIAMHTVKLKKESPEEMAVECFRELYQKSTALLVVLAESQPERSSAKGIMYKRIWDELSRAFKQFSVKRSSCSAPQVEGRNLKRDFAYQAWSYIAYIVEHYDGPLDMFTADDIYDWIELVNDSVLSHFADRVKRLLYNRPAVDLKDVRKDPYFPSWRDDGPVRKACLMAHLAERTDLSPSVTKYVQGYVENTIKGNYTQEALASASYYTAAS